MRARSHFSARLSIARLLAPLGIHSGQTTSDDPDLVLVVVAESDDEEFTEGIVGVVGSRLQLALRALGKGARHRRVETK